MGVDPRHIGGYVVMRKIALLLTVAGAVMACEAMPPPTSSDRTETAGSRPRERSLAEECAGWDPHGAMARDKGCPTPDRGPPASSEDGTPASAPAREQATGLDGRPCYGGGLGCMTASQRAADARRRAEEPDSGLGWALDAVSSPNNSGGRRGTVQVEVKSVK